MTKDASATTETAAVAAQPANAAPKTKPSTKGVSSKKGAAKGAKTAKATKAAKKQAKPASKKASKPSDGQPREGSKKAIVLEMLRRKDGATLAEIMKATGWQKAHSVRGFISIITKKMDLPIASLKNDKGERYYQIEN
jgi:hypothetical protein